MSGSVAGEPAGRALITFTSMYDQTEQAINVPLAMLSLDNLAEFAIAEKLIDRFDVTGDHATFLQGEQRFRLPARQASTFLIGMLRGRSWYIDDSQTESPKHSSAVPKLSLTPSETQPHEPGASRSIEATLDTLLTFTNDVGIILGYEKDAGRRLVKIDIPACSSVFSYVDAVGYLIDCLQHEVRSTTDAV